MKSIMLNLWYNLKYPIKYPIPLNILIKWNCSKSLYMTPLNDIIPNFAFSIYLSCHWCAYVFLLLWIEIYIYIVREIILHWNIYLLLYAQSTIYLPTAWLLSSLLASNMVLIALDVINEPWWISMESTELVGPCYGPYQPQPNSMESIKLAESYYGPYHPSPSSMTSTMLGGSSYALYQSQPSSMKSINLHKLHWAFGRLLWAQLSSMKSTKLHELHQANWICIWAQPSYMSSTMWGAPDTRWTELHDLAKLARSHCRPNGALWSPSSPWLNQACASITGQTKLPELT